MDAPPIKMPKVSIEEFDPGARNLDSPRTLESCLNLGIDLDDLYTKPLSYFQERAKDHRLSLAKVLLEHYETRRKENVNEVKAERKRVILEETRLLAARGISSPTALEMDPVALAKEAIFAKGRERVEEERRKLEFQKKKMQEEMDAQMAGQKLLADRALASAAKEAEAAKEAAEAKRSRERQKKMEEKKRAQELLKKMEDELDRAKEMRRLAQEEFAREKEEREKQDKVAKELLAKRKQEEEDARLEKISKERRKLEEIEERAEDQRVRFPRAMRAQKYFPSCLPCPPSLTHLF